MHTYIHMHRQNTKTNKSNYLQTHTQNQNQNCLSLCLKNVQGADNTSYGTEFQRNTEFTKKE